MPTFKVATKRFICCAVLWAGVHKLLARPCCGAAPFRFVGAASWEAGATLYGLRAPIAPIAHWPLPLASVMETRFLNVSPRKTGHSPTGGRPGRRRTACWRFVTSLSHARGAPPAGQVSKFGPRVASTSPFVRLAVACNVFHTVVFLNELANSDTSVFIFQLRSRTSSPVFPIRQTA